MKKLWARFDDRASLMLIGLCVTLFMLPLVPDLPFPFALVLLAFALVAAVPVFVQVVRALCGQVSASAQPSAVRRDAPDLGQLRRPAAPGTPGTVRSRAPSHLTAALG